MSSTHILPKDQPAGPWATDLGLIHAVYADAIAFGGREGNPFRGLPSLIAVIGVSMGFVLFWLIWRSTFRSEIPLSSDIGGLIFGVTVTVFSFVVGIGLLIWTYLIDFYTPDELRVIFDRKRQRVCWVSMESGGSHWIQTLCNRRAVVRAAPWSHIRGEYRITAGANTNTVSHQSELVFVAGMSTAPDARVFDEFGLAPALMTPGAVVPALWEHVRRYMHEGGPPLAPGTTAVTQPRPVPRHYFDSLALVSPWGARYLQWWRKAPIGTLVHHVMFFGGAALVWFYEQHFSRAMRPDVALWMTLTVPGLIVLWALMNWLSYATALRVKWPEPIQRELGPQLSAGEIVQGKGGALVAG